MRKARTGVALLLVTLGLVVPAGAVAAPKVLVVGDSLEELTSPYLQRYLPGIRLTINAHQSGLNSAATGFSTTHCKTDRLKMQ